MRTITLMMAWWLVAAPDPQLRRLQEEIAHREAALQALSSQERSITRALGELDESIARLDAEGDALDKRARAASANANKAAQNAARLNAELEQTQERLALRLRALFRLGPTADLELILGSRSLKDLVWRRAVLRRLAAADADLAQQVETRRTQALEQRAEMQRLGQELERARTAHAEVLLVAQRARLNREETLRQVAEQKGAEQRRLEDLAASRRRLQQVMEDLPPALDAKGFAALRGRLPWPTQGTVERRFGQPLDGQGDARMHSGITLAAPLGQQVTCVASGRVVHAGWLRGFGQILIVDHGDGFHTLMAHLSRVNVNAGDMVQNGDVVAYVGDSESLEGPRLYFELRAKGRPVDPLKWLQRTP